MLNHFDECNEFVIRYSRVDLFGLRQEQLSRKKPSIDLCVELQALGVWKHGEQLINSVTNAIPATKRCITTTTTAICNNHNNNNHKRDNVHEMHHQRYISSSSSPIAQSLPITKVISSSSLTAAAAGTTTTMSNLLDQRSISSSHLMPAFVKRRAAAQTATAATNVIATNTTTIVSANLANSNINNNNKSIVPTTTTTSFTRRQKHVDDNEQQQQPRVVPLTQQQQVAVSERRIGSGRLMPRNWDKQDDKQLQQRMNGVNSGGGGGGGLLMRRNNNQNNYERSTTPTSTANFQQQQQRQQQQRGGAYGKNHHNSYYQRNSNNNNNHHHHHSNVHHSREIEEPEWFSGGPTSQNDTIELRGFDDKDNNDDDDVCNRDIQDDDQDDLQQQKFQSKRINLNDLKCEPKPQQQCDNTKDTDAEDNHHVDDKEPFNLENFLNSDAWEDSINHDESSSHKPMANSRFSQWFMGPKNVEESKDTDANKLNENKLLEFFNDSKLPLILTTDNQTKQQEMQKSFTSVEELEARMLHSDNEKAFVIELQQQQQHKTESSTPQSTENVAAFKKLLEQLSVNDLQQQSQPKGNHNNNMTLMVTLNQSMSAQPTPTATTCTTPMPMATIPPIEMKNFLHFQHQQKLKQQQLLLNGSPTPSVSQLFPVSTLQRVYNEVLCNIHLAFSPDQVQKRIEAQHLYQTIMRGEVSIGFLEQELTNPLLSMHAKDIIAIVVREVTRAISPQMMMVHHIQLRHLAQAASVAAPPSVASVVQPPPLAVPPGNVPTTLITLPILPGAVAPNNKLNVVATPPQTQQQPILLNNNHNNLNKVDFNPEHYTQNLNHHSHHQHHLNNHQQQHNDVQEQQRQQHLNQQLDGIQQQRLHLNCSPIPNSLAFTPTSVLRKMTAEKDIPNNSNDQQQQQPRMILGGGHKLQSQQQPQQPLAIKVPPTTVIGGALCLNEPLQQQQIRNIGRPLLKAPIVTQHILSGQQQQQQQFDDLHHHQQQRLLAMRQQQQQQQQHLMQQQIHLQQQRQHQRNTNLSPTSNQLAQWFSPELLAQASAGKFPTLNMQQTLSLEEFEKNIQQLQQQQTSTTAVAQN